MTNECSFKRLTSHWGRWWSVRPLFKSTLLLRRLIGEEDARRNAINLLELKPGQRVLDLGCGLGANLRYLRETGVEVIAVDSNSENVEAARTEVRANNLTHVRVMTWKEAEASLDEASFDAVLCTGIFTSTVNLERVFYDVCRWLKPQGLLSVVDYVETRTEEQKVLSAPFAAAVYLCTGSNPNSVWFKGLLSFCDVLFTDELQGGLSCLVLARKREGAVLSRPEERVEIPVCKPREAKFCPSRSDIPNKILDFVSNAGKAFSQWRKEKSEALAKRQSEKKRAKEAARLDEEKVAKLVEVTSTPEISKVSEPAVELTKVDHVDSEPMVGEGRDEHPETVACSVRAEVPVVEPEVVENTQPLIEKQVPVVEEVSEQTQEQEEAEIEASISILGSGFRYVPEVEEPVIEPVSEKPALLETVVEPVSEEPAALEPVVEPVSEEPAALEPVVEPVSEEPASLEPVAEPVSEESFSGQETLSISYVSEDLNKTQLMEPALEPVGEAAFVAEDRSQERTPEQSTVIETSAVEEATLPVGKEEVVSAGGRTFTFMSYENTATPKDVQPAGEASQPTAPKEEIVSAGGRTFSFMPYDTTVTTTRLAPRLPEGRTTSRKSRETTPLKIEHGERPLPALGGTSKALRIETSEHPYVPSVDVQRAAVAALHEQYPNAKPANRETLSVAPDTYTDQYRTTSVDDSYTGNSVATPQPPAQVLPPPAPRQHLPLLHGVVSGLPQLPSLAMRPGILRPHGQQDFDNPTAPIEPPPPNNGGSGKRQGRGKKRR